MAKTQTEKTAEANDAKAKAALLEEALEAYGVEREYVFSSRVDLASGTVVILTNGGARVQYKQGDKVAKLDPIRVTGINPEWEKRKPIVGKKK